MRDRRYRVSPPRKDAEIRLAGLRRGCVAACGKSVPTEVRDMTFQSAVFQASATLEEYFKQIFDHWLYELKTNNHRGASLPDRVRYTFLARELKEAFTKHTAPADEIKLAEKIERNSQLLNFALGISELQNYINGSIAYKDRKYPSTKNIKILYSRIGCDNIFDIISSKINGDAEMQLQGFNDIRTALAHSNPPQITLTDVKRNIDVISVLIREFDRVNSKIFSDNFGSGVW